MLKLLLTAVQLTQKSIQNHISVVLDRIVPLVAFGYLLLGIHVERPKVTHHKVVVNLLL